jgi:hypothetical protein
MRPSRLICRLLAAALTMLVGGRALAAPPPTKDDCVAVFAISNGFHSGVALPAEAVEAAGLPTFGGAWVEFGWGEARAYQASRLGAGDIARVVLAPGPSTLLIAPLTDQPDRLWSSGVLEFGVSREGLAQLARDVAAEAERDPEGRLIVLSERRGGQFVAARSRFRLWRMCNGWAAGRLRAAGLELRTPPLLTAGGLMKRIDRLPTCEELR